MSESKQSQRGRPKAWSHKDYARSQWAADTFTREELMKFRKEANQE